MKLIYNNTITIPNKVDLVNYSKEELIFFTQTLKNEVRDYKRNSYWTILK